jgi:hypothetical protein
MSGATFQHGPAAHAVRGPFLSAGQHVNYDVSADAQRFIMILDRTVDTRPTQIEYRAQLTRQTAAVRSGGRPMRIAFLPEALRAISTFGVVGSAFRRTYRSVLKRTHVLRASESLDAPALSGGQKPCVSRPR